MTIGREDLTITSEPQPCALDRSDIEHADLDHLDVFAEALG